MRDHPVTFELLNAYVDGELDAAQAAEVARAVANDPALAREVAALSRLRHAVADTVEAPAIALPQPARESRRAAVAAAVVVMLLAGGAAFLGGRDRTPPEAPWLAEAWSAHQAWSVAQSTLVPARQTAALVGAYVPDLTASRLTLTHSEIRTLADGGQALIAGYQGSRGCKVSLIVFPSRGGLTDALQALPRDGQEAYGWRVGGLDYMILSDGMESRRFGQLAESVHDSSGRHAPFDAETRTALRESRDNSAPCNA